LLTVRVLERGWGKGGGDPDFRSEISLEIARKDQKIRSVGQGKISLLWLLFDDDANKKKAAHTIENDERTANTHRNINGNPESKENTNNDEKEN